MTDLSVSILLPIRNEGGSIKTCLEAVRRQSYSGEMEILVVDGESMDDTREVVGRIALEDGRIRLLTNPRRIVPTGMNIALRQVKGEIIIRVDGHCIIDNDYVENCIRHLIDDSVDGVGGPMKSIGQTSLSESIAIGMSSKFGVGDSSFRTESGATKLVDSVPFPAYKRSIIDKVGLYDEELVRNQDDEYNYRIREAGGRILIADDVRSVYYSRGSYSKLWKQYYQYGFWKVRVLQKHPRQMSARQFVPTLFVAGLAGSVLLALVLPDLAWLFWLILGIYTSANLFASVIIAKNRGWQHVLRLPIIYTILHVSYGSGFLVGLVKFVNRWGDKVGKVPQR